ncbi:hypothetical protein B7494_g3073 [Chlorociboria aeruginascens]|nr:hypothetical protein B7494_g3073 [Chlorociboria aeruginascens]
MASHQLLGFSLNDLHKYIRTVVSCTKRLLVQPRDPKPKRCTSPPSSSEKSTNRYPAPAASLPYELILHIFSYIHPLDLCTSTCLALICKPFYHAFRTVHPYPIPLTSRYYRELSYMERDRGRVGEYSGPLLAALLQQGMRECIVDGRKVRRVWSNSKQRYVLGCDDEGCDWDLELRSRIREFEIAECVYDALRDVGSEDEGDEP